MRYIPKSTEDILGIRKYIVDRFGFREYGDAFTKKMKRGIESIREFPEGFSMTGFRYRGYNIYLKPNFTYLILYTIDKKINTITVLRVMKDGMNWRFILAGWLGDVNNC